MPDNLMFIENMQYICSVTKKASNDNATIQTSNAQTRFTFRLALLKSLKLRGYPSFLSKGNNSSG